MFPNQSGNAYTDSGFKGMWNKLVVAAVAEKAIETLFTFHDLRAYYVTQYKQQRGHHRRPWSGPRAQTPRPSSR